MHGVRHSVPLTPFATQQSITAPHSCAAMASALPWQAVSSSRQPPIAFGVQLHAWHSGADVDGIPMHAVSGMFGAAPVAPGMPPVVPAAGPVAGGMVVSAPGAAGMPAAPLSLLSSPQPSAPAQATMHAPIRIPRPIAPPFSIAPMTSHLGGRASMW